MDKTDIDAAEAALADLRRKLGKRADQAGFAANVEALKARIAQLEAQIADRRAEGATP